MSSLFSSPSKQAQSAASAAQGISQQSIKDAEQYVSGQEQQLRSALQGLGPNPFISAGSHVSPTKIDPSGTQDFAAPPPPSQAAPAPGGFVASGGVTAPMYSGATGPLAQSNPFRTAPPVMRNPGAP